MNESNLKDLTRDINGVILQCINGVILQFPSSR